MVRILLVCNAGMSTSLLVTAMVKAAKAKEIDLEIQASPLISAESEILKWDIAMLGPQVRHCYANLVKKTEGKVPIEIIDMKDYGLMRGENVLNTALEKIEEFKNK